MNFNKDKIERIIGKINLLIRKYIQNSLLYKKGLNKKHFKILSKDQKRELKKYWKKYVKGYYTNFNSIYTSINGNFDLRYIPDNLYYSYIDNYFNNRKLSYGVDDKAYYDLLLNNIKQPTVILRKINGLIMDMNFKVISLNSAINYLNNDNYILKPSIDTCGGKDIKFINKNMNNDELKKILSEYDNYVVQVLVKQHEELDCIHRESLNTVRVISLLYNKKVYILSAVLRMGINGSKVDNASSGGIVCGIDKYGILQKYAYNTLGEKFKSHPQGFVFEGHKITAYNKIIDIIKEEAPKFSHFRLISWDFAIDQFGDPVFIEFNLKNGQLDFHQYTNGPLFGDLTEKVLEEVFIEQNRK